jgi:hypothetical protein
MGVNMSLNNKFFTIIIFFTLFLLRAENSMAMLENLFSNTSEIFIPEGVTQPAFTPKSFKYSDKFEPTCTGEIQTVAKGLMQAKNTIENLPEFRIYFEGKAATSDDNGFYSFPVDDPNISKYRVVVTRRLQHLFNKKNTLDNFKLIPEKNYLCYTFKKLGRYGSWVKTEKNLDHKKFILPKNSIVVLINPKYVDRVEEWNIELSKNIIKLPKIVLKSDISEKELKRIAAKSILYLEDAVFHEKVGRRSASTETKTGKIKVTLP